MSCPYGRRVPRGPGKPGPYSGEGLGNLFGFEGLGVGVEG